MSNTNLTFRILIFFLIFGITNKETSLGERRLPVHSTFMALKQRYCISIHVNTCMCKIEKSSRIGA